MRHPERPERCRPRRATGCDGDGRGPRTPAPASLRVAALSMKPQSQHGRGNGDLARRPRQATSSGDLGRRPRQARAAPRAGRGREGGIAGAMLVFALKVQNDVAWPLAPWRGPVAWSLAPWRGRSPGVTLGARSVGVAIADSVPCIAVSPCHAHERAATAAPDISLRSGNVSSGRIPT